MGMTYNELREQRKNKTGLFAEGADVQINNFSALIIQAAEELKRTPGNEEFVKELLEYKDALVTVSSPWKKTADKAEQKAQRDNIKQALDKLDGFYDFLSNTDENGVSGYEKIKDGLSLGKVFGDAFDDSLVFLRDNAKVRINIDKLKEQTEKVKFGRAIITDLKSTREGQFAASLYAHKQQQLGGNTASEAKPFDFLTKLKQNAQRQLKINNQDPEELENYRSEREKLTKQLNAMDPDDLERLLVEDKIEKLDKQYLREFSKDKELAAGRVISAISEIENNYTKNVRPGSSAADKQNFILSGKNDVKALQEAYAEYEKLFKDSPVKPEPWPDQQKIEADAKALMDPVMNEKDPNFCIAIAEKSQKIDQDQYHELMRMLKSDQDLMPEKVKFETLEVPGKPEASIEDAYKHYYGLDGLEGEEEMDEADPVLMAVSERGKAFTSREEILKELSQPNRPLFVFKKDGSLPIVLVNVGGKLYISDREISSVNQLSSKNSFEPKKSLDAKDITDIPSYKTINSLKYLKKDYQPKVKKKNIEHWFDDADVDSRDYKEWLDSHARPPKLGFARTFWRGTVKLFTLGRKETQSYRDYQQRKKRWALKKSTYEVRLNALKGQKKAVKEGQKKASQILSQIDDRLFELERRIKSGPGKIEKELREYHSHTEVRMEGIADIIKNGKVTQDNIFANTWLAKQAVTGKKITEPGVHEKLIEYIASRTIEKAVMKETIDDVEYSRARNQMLVEKLNNGEALAKLEKSGTLRKIIQNQGNKPLDPDKIFMEYEAWAEAEHNMKMTPLARLKEERKALIEKFGERPITKDCLPEIAKLNALDQFIRIGEKDANKLTDEDVRGVIADIHTKPSKIYRKVNLQKALGAENQKAIAKLETNMNKAAAKIDKAMEGIPQNVKNAWGYEANVFGLEKMAEMFNKTVELEKQKNAKSIQPQKK